MDQNPATLLFYCLFCFHNSTSDNPRDRLQSRHEQDLIPHIDCKAKRYASALIVFDLKRPISFRFSSQACSDILSAGLLPVSSAEQGFRHLLLRLSSGFPVVRVPMKMHDREDVNTIGFYVV
jgi:hypothetical protein